MKFSRKQIVDAVWILALILIVFTPVGFHFRVMVNKLFAPSAKEIATEERQILKNYHWSLRDLDGNAFNLNDAKGEVILINFWATWCPPCVAELPSLQKLHGEYQDKVTFIFVTNEERDKVVAFLNKRGYQLPIYSQLTRVPPELEHSSIPATYIIGKSGKIAVAESGVADWNAEATKDLLDRLLEQEK